MTVKMLMKVEMSVTIMKTIFLTRATSFLDAHHPQVSHIRAFQRSGAQLSLVDRKAVYEVFVKLEICRASRRGYSSLMLSSKLASGSVTFVMLGCPIISKGLSYIFYFILVHWLLPILANMSRQVCLRKS